MQPWQIDSTDTAWRWLLFSIQWMASILPPRPMVAPFICGRCRRFSATSCLPTCERLHPVVVANVIVCFVLCIPNKPKLNTVKTVTFSVYPPPSLWGAPNAHSIFGARAAHKARNMATMISSMNGIRRWMLCTLHAKAAMAAVATRFMYATQTLPFLSYEINFATVHGIDSFSLVYTTAIRTLPWHLSAFAIFSTLPTRLFDGCCRRSALGRVCFHFRHCRVLSASTAAFFLLA